MQAAMRGMTGSGDGVHVMTGPIAVEGAVEGDVLKVEILDLYPRLNPQGESYGVNVRNALLWVSLRSVGAASLLVCYALWPSDVCMRAQAAAWWGFHYGINGQADLKNGLLGTSPSVLPSGAEPGRLLCVPRKCGLCAPQT